MVVVNREILVNVSLARTLLAGTNLDKISQKKSAEQFSKSIETYDAVTSWAVKSVTAVKKTTIVNYFGHGYLKEMSAINVGVENSGCLENAEISVK